jgi:hypothetical protein
MLAVWEGYCREPVVVTQENPNEVCYIWLTPTTGDAWLLVGFSFVYDAVWLWLGYPAFDSSHLADTPLYKKIFEVFFRPVQMPVQIVSIPQRNMG